MTAIPKTKYICLSCTTIVLYIHTDIVHDEIVSEPVQVFLGSGESVAVSTILRGEEETSYKENPDTILSLVSLKVSSIQLLL